MPLLKCNTCQARFESDSFQEALSRLDHVIGLHNGHPCPNDGSNILHWTVGDIEYTIGYDRVEPNILSIEQQEEKQTKTKKK